MNVNLIIDEWNFYILLARCEENWKCLLIIVSFVRNQGWKLKFNCLFIKTKFHVISNVQFSTILHHTFDGGWHFSSEKEEKTVDTDRKIDKKHTIEMFLLPHDGIYNCLNENEKVFCIPLRKISVLRNGKCIAIIQILSFHYFSPSMHNNWNFFFFINHKPNKFLHSFFSVSFYNLNECRLCADAMCTEVDEKIYCNKKSEKAFLIQL